MYTKPTYRGQGLASALLNHLVVEAKRRDVRKLFLEASTIGKPTYKNMGLLKMTPGRRIRLKA